MTECRTDSTLQMSTTLNNYFRQRLRQMEEMYPEPTTFGDCDCTSYSYFVFSIVLFTLGSFITAMTLSGGDDYIFSNLGHMWLVGPIFICSGMMIAVKSVLYLRRKSVIQMLLRQRALLRGLQEMAQQSHSQTSSQMVRNASTLTLPPAYDLLMGASGTNGGPSEAPPPTYEEAMFLINDEKLRTVLDTLQTNAENSRSKETAD